MAIGNDHAEWCGTHSGSECDCHPGDPKPEHLKLRDALEASVQRAIAARDAKQTEAAS